MFYDIDDKISILLVDYHELVRNGIARLIQDEDDMAVLAQLGSGEEALEYLSQKAPFYPDIILVDARMPGMGGIEATRSILQQAPKSRVIAISSVATGIIPSQMLRSGAMAFIPTNVSVAELLKAIRTVHAGNHYVTHEVAVQLALDPFTKSGKSQFEKLSRRELQIAQMLVDGQKVSKISSDLKLNCKTVYSYRYRIFEKLGIRNDVELSILAIKYGLVDDSREYEDINVLQLNIG